jgi:hypothetical protein
LMSKRRSKDLSAVIKRLKKFAAGASQPVRKLLTLP